MDQGVATQCRAGDVLSEDECRGEAHTGTWVVNGAPWTLPCSLSSLLAMNCRARAEALARRLQERVRGVDVEQTSLVGPHEDHYATLECRRHASLDGPDLGTFAEHNMRPIHVVTSEPTLHLSLPELQPPELDSDVYYDFDIASPDDTTEQAEGREGMREEEEEDKKKDMEDENEGQEEEEERRAREKPESGCVTSVTSPVMFDDYDLDEDGVDDNLPSSQELCLPSSDSSLPLTSPDADLCAVRKILSTTSLTEGHCCPGNEVMTGQQCNSSSPGNHCIDIECCEIGKCCPDSCRDSEKSACECSSDSSEESNVWEYFPGNSARDCAIKHIAQPQVASTVAAQLAPEVCWCHTSATTQSASSVPAGDTINGDDPAEVGGGATAAAAANSASIRCGAVNKLLSSEEKSYHCECYNNPVVINSDKIDDDDDDGSECVSEVVIDCVKVISDDEEETLLLLTEEVPAAFRDTVLLPAGGHDESGEMELGRGEEGEVAGDESDGPNDALSVATSVRRADTISGASSPPTLLPHLCLTSEGQLETAMEARGDHEADLREPHGIYGMESEGEEIETLGEDEMSEEDENEEDVEEEAIMTGKFRNFRRYTERVRRLSDEIEDRISPTKIVYCDDPSLPVYDSDSSHLTQDEDEDEEVTDSRHTPQLSEKDIEDQENLQLEDEDEEEEDVGAGTRSSSEETDPEKVEEFKMRIKRSSSLKCGKTPPGTPGRKKIVRFADMLGLDLAAVRTFLAGVPHVPRSAFWDLELEREAAEAAAVAASNLGQPPPLPRRVLTPLFQEPALQPGFMDRVRQQKVVLESVVVGDDMSVRGVVRVLNIDFHKNVYVRYTFDHWRNFHETTATYLPGSHDGLTDRFSILLWGSFLKDDGALVFCIRYNTNNQDFWDNNYGRNYVLQCYTRGSSEAAEAEVPQRPQNSSSVQQQQQQQHHYTSSGGAGSSGAGNYRSSFGGRVDSPPTPGDPWTTIFF